MNRIRFTAINLCLFIAGHLCGQTIELTAEEEAYLQTNPVVVLGGDPSWEPMIIENPNGEITGFERDYLVELSKVTGLKFELVADVWSDIVNRAKNGEIDGLVYSSRQPQRESYFEFTIPYNQFQVGFYAAAGQKMLSDISELFGAKVGVQESDQFMNNYLDNIPEIEKVVYNSRSEMIAATLAGEVQYFLSALDINYYLWKNSLPGIKLVYLPDGSGFDVVYSITPREEPLVNILNKGIKEVGARKKRELIKKWLRVEENQSLLLNESELRFLSRTPSVTVVTIENWMPIVNTKNGRVGGLVGDYLDLINESLTLNISSVGTGDSAAIDSYEKQPNSIFIYPDFQRKKPDLYYSEPFLKIPYGLAMRRGSPFFSEIKSLGELKVGVMSFNPHYEHIAERYPNLVLVPLQSTQNGLDRILSGELDGYIGSISTLNYNIQTKGYSDLFIAALTDFSTSIHFSSNNRTLLSIIEKAAATVPDVEKQTLIKKWYGSEVVKTIDRELAYRIAVISMVLLLILLGWVISLRKVIKKRKIIQNMLQQNQANILALVENTDAMIYSLDIDLCLRAKNTALESFLENFTEETVRIGAPIVNYLPEAERTKWLLRCQRALEGEKFSEQDSLKLGSEYRSYISSFNPIEIDGAVTGISIITEDVTELVKINQYMISLMDTAYDHIFIKDLNRRYVIASQSLADLNGFASWKEMIGKREADISEFNARQIAEDEIRVLEEGLHAINKEHQFMDREGEMRWIQATTEPIYDQDGEVVGLSGVSRDITRRREAERQQKILISSIENSSDFISFMDENYQFIYINRFGIERLGFEDYENVHIKELVDPVTLKIVMNGMQKFVLEGKIWEAEFDVMHWKSGERIPMDHQIFPIYDDHEGFICFANVARDLTERNKLQEQVLRSKVNEELMSATLKAEDKERFRIAHELHDGIQQKIATVNIYLQSLEERSGEDKSILTNSIEKLNEAISEIRNMSHSLIPRALRNSGLAATLYDEVEQLNNNSAFKAEFHENIGSKRFHQDIELNLYRIFQEATANIFKHANAQNVLVQLMESDNRLSLMIEDDGDGFNSGDMEKVGFGLSSLKNRAVVINAHIEIDSVPGEGTSILIEAVPDSYEGE